MKFRIITAVLIAIVLGALYFFVRDDKSTGTPSGLPDTNDIRSLKIN